MSADVDEIAVAQREEWMRLAVASGTDPDFAGRAYDTAHRIGRGAGRLEAIRMIRETGSIVDAIDAMLMLIDAELTLIEVEL